MIDIDAQKINIKNVGATIGRPKKDVFYETY